MTRLVSFNLVQHTELNYAQFMPYQPFWASTTFLYCRRKIPYFINTLAYHQCMCHHAMKVLEKFRGNATLWYKLTMTFKKNANSFWLTLPIVPRLILIDTLDNVENITNYAIIGQTSCLLIWFSLKANSFRVDRQKVFVYHINGFDGMIPNCIWVCISAKLCVCHKIILLVILFTIFQPFWVKSS